MILHDSSSKGKRYLFFFPLVFYLFFVLFPAASFAEEAATKAAILLTGGSEISWICGHPFLEPGYSAYGADGKDATSLVEVTGDPVCWKIGDYKIHYALTVSGETVAEEVRTVHIIPNELPETSSAEEDKIVYLTFDDGPCENTELVLDILNKYHIKATFFVVGRRAAQSDIVTRIAEEGHSIGIHCYSHGLDKIYLSEEAYFEDLIHAQQVIYEKTGFYTNLLRFPGGSYSARSLFKQTPGGQEEIESRLADMGFRYYDWNVQPEHPSERTDYTYEAFKNLIPEYPVSICLQHDTCGYSVTALDEMIQWGLKHGYTFRALDATVPEFHTDPKTIPHY